MPGASTLSEGWDSRPARSSRQLGVFDQLDSGFAWHHLNAARTVLLTGALTRILMRSGLLRARRLRSAVQPGEFSVASFWRYLTFVGADRER